MMIKKTSICGIAGLILVLFTSGALAQGCNEHLPNMRLTAKQNHLSLNDNTPVCVTREADGTINFWFKIKIAEPVQVVAGQVTVVQKDNSAQPQVEIKGDNLSPTNKVSIHVTGTADDGDEFQYYIKVAGIGVLDPTVRVVGGQQMQILQAKGLEDFLDTWNLPLQAVDELQKTIAAGE